MTLAERLSTYDEKYWDFSEYRMTLLLSGTLQ